MEQMKKGTLAVLVLMASFCCGHVAIAQPRATVPASSRQQDSLKFSDAELASFIKANTRATEIQKENRAAMVAAIEAENLTLDRFNELVEAHGQNKLKEVAKGSDEISAFGNAAQQVAKMQPKTQQKVQQAIEEQGLNVEKYEAIMQAYEQDPQVQARIQRMVNGRQPGQ